MTSRLLLTSMVIVVLAATTLSNVAMAQRGMGPRGVPPGTPPPDSTGQRPDPLAALQTALNLTAAQVESIRSLMTVRDQAVQSLMPQVQQARQALDALLAQASPNPTDLGNAMLAVRAAEGQIRAVNDQFQTNVMNVLTADQKKIIEDARVAGRGLPGLGLLLGQGPPFGPRGGRQ